MKMKSLNLTLEKNKLIQVNAFKRWKFSIWFWMFLIRGHSPVLSKCSPILVDARLTLTIVQNIKKMAILTRHRIKVAKDDKQFVEKKWTPKSRPNFRAHCKLSKNEVMKNGISTYK